MALNIISNVQLDMKAPNTVIVYANQYDSAGSVRAQLLNSGESWAVPAGAKAVVMFKKSDNIGGFYDVTEFGVAAVEIDSDRSVIYINYDPQVLTTAGRVAVQINFYQNDQRLSSFAFYTDVQASAVTSGEIASSWLFNILSQEIAQTLTVATTPQAMTDWLEANITQETGYVIDNTLTVAGAASDAQATGKMVTVSNLNPNTVANKVWVKKTPATLEIPTMDDLDELNRQLSDVLSDVESAINYVTTNVLADTVWIRGSIDSSGGDWSDANRIKTQDYIDISGLSKIKIIIVSGYKCGWHFYNAEKVHVSGSSAWVTSNTTVDIPSTAIYLRINLAKDNDQSPAEVSWGSNVQAVYSTDSISDIKNDISQLQYELINVNDTLNLKPINTLKDAAWVRGSIDSSGGDWSDANRIKTNYIDISGIASLRFEINSGYKYGVHFYNSSKSHVYSVSGWQTDNITVPVPSTAKYLRCNLAKNDDTNPADLAWGAYLKALYEYPITQTIDIGTGSNVYYGEKVNLALCEKQYNCDIQTWKAFNSTDIPDVGDYHLNLNQSIVAFGGYMFALNDGGGIAVIDYSTKELVDYVTVTPSSSNHQNSAQFSDIYYDADDEFPLLLISRCGNSSSGMGNDTCLVYRVTKSSNDFTFTLVNTIDSDIRTYGNSWFIDNNSRKIGMVGYTNGTYSITTNNPIRFFEWELPTATDILSGTTITLKKEDCIAIAEIEYMLLQSACANGGLVYIGAGTAVTGAGTQFVISIDVAKGMIITKIPLTSDKETEGVTIYDGSMYVSNVNYSSSEEPLTVYKIDF